jgi:parallel beta-helix repeat protein
VSGNVCTSNTQVGIIVSGAEDYNIVTGNHVKGNTNAVGVSTAGTNTIVKDNIANSATNVASAATITIPAHIGPYIGITGTTNITSITASYLGRSVVLRSTFYTGTIVKGSNLKLASDFVMTSDDTLSLMCDGVNWYETGRVAI